MQTDKLFTINGSIDQGRIKEFIGKIFPHHAKYPWSEKLFDATLCNKNDWKKVFESLANDHRQNSAQLLAQIYSSVSNAFIFHLHYDLGFGLSQISSLIKGNIKDVLSTLRWTYSQVFPQNKILVSQFFFYGDWVQQGSEFHAKDLLKQSLMGVPSYQYLWKHQQFEQILSIHHLKVKALQGNDAIVSDDNVVISPKTKSPLFYGWWGKVMRETLVMVFIFIGFIFLYNQFSKFYQTYLLNKIAELEINHSSPDTKLVFKSQTPPAKRKIDLSVDDFKKIQEKFKEDDRQEFMSPETDILATNVDLGQTNSDKYSIFSFSNSEDDFRDTQYGFYKSYRLLVKSSDVFASKSKILDLVKKFQISPVTSELVGNEIPGGVFFNLHVPSKSIENFVRELNQIDSVNVYISKSSRPSPPGKEKVFLWIKEI